MEGSGAHHAIRPLHQQGGGAGDVERHAAHGLQGRRGAGTRRGHRRVPRPDAGRHGGQFDLHRHRVRHLHRQRAEAVDARRAHRHRRLPERDLAQGLLRRGDRQPAVRLDVGAERQRVQAQRLQAATTSLPRRRPREAGRPDGLRHQPLHHGQAGRQGAPTWPSAPIWWAPSACRKRRSSRTRAPRW